MTVNISVLVTIAIGSVIFAQSPLGAVKLLWINLIMDTFAALALATEPPVEAILKNTAPMKNTGNQKTAILSPTVLRQIYGVSAWNVLIMLILMVFGQWLADFDYEFSCPIGRAQPT